MSQSGAKPLTHTDLCLKKRSMALALEKSSWRSAQLGCTTSAPALDVQTQE